MTSPPVPPNNIAAAYGRTSTNHQDQSVAVQNAALQLYAERNCLTLATDCLFLEDDVSGSVEFQDRPKGRALLHLLRNRPAKDRPAHLIVPKIDRLGRGALDVQNTIAGLHKLGITIHVIDLGGMSFDTRSAIGGMIISLLAWFAQMELERIRGRIQEVMDHKRERGELTGTVPYGWSAVPTGRHTSKGVEIKTLEANPAEQQWIHYMADLRAAGMSYQSVARELNRLKVPAKVPAGTRIRVRNRKVMADGTVREEKWVAASGRWQAGNVHHVLTNKYTQELLAGRDTEAAAQAA